MPATMRTEDVPQEHMLSKWFEPPAELDAVSVVFHDEKACTFRFNDRGSDGAGDTTMMVGAGPQAAIDRFGLILIEEAG